MKRKEFLSNSLFTVMGLHFAGPATHIYKNFQQFNGDTFSLEETTIAALQQAMKSGKTTAEIITRMYLKRIDAIDKHGPELKSVIEVNPDAVQLARRLDSERKRGTLRGPLHGIPVLIKDNIDTGDKMMTTAGSLALLNHRATTDAFIVKKMRETGAVILGKTNLSEWANFRSTRSSSGWSSRGGQTKNPYVLDRSPCGSSSGSGVAVAANLCAVAVGSETDGSINCPASLNGVVGIKPTVGLVSRAGIIPISATQDTAGPLARTVTDAAILLGAITGVDQNDVATAQSAGKNSTDYTKFLDATSLAGKRIGVEKSFLKGHEAVTPLYTKAIEQLKQKGATVVEVEFVDGFYKINADETKLLQFEFKDGLNKYLSTSNTPVKNLADVIAFNKQHEAQAMPYFKQETFDSSQIRPGLESSEYKTVVTKYDESRIYYNKFFDEHKLDAICGPANGLAWNIDLINGDHFTGYGLYSPAALCGYPSLTVPMGNVRGLPVGLSFIGKAYMEPLLISIAYAYEQASKNRTVPKFKPTFS